MKRIKLWILWIHLSTIAPGSRFFIRTLHYDAYSIRLSFSILNSQRRIYLSSSLSHLIYMHMNKKSIFLSKKMNTHWSATSYLLKDKNGTGLSLLHFSVKNGVVFSMLHERKVEWECHVVSKCSHMMMIGESACKIDGPICQGKREGSPGKGKCIVVMGILLLLHHPSF